MSDRIEKEPADSTVVARLENSGRFVVRTNWRMHISAPLQAGKKLIEIFNKMWNFLMHMKRTMFQFACLI